MGRVAGLSSTHAMVYAALEGKLQEQFDATIAWGMVFLSPVEIQEVVIQKMANVLFAGGKVLFTAPSQKMKWEDAVTEVESRLLGADKYRAMLIASCLSLIEEFEDENDHAERCHP